MPRLRSLRTDFDKQLTATLRLAVAVGAPGRVAATAGIARRANVPAAAVLTQVRGRIEDTAAAVVTLRSWGVPVYAAELRMAVAVQRAYGQPLTSGPLLRFGIDLLTEISKEAS